MGSLDIKTLSSKLGLLGYRATILDIQTLVSAGDEGKKLYFIDDLGKSKSSIKYDDIIPYVEAKLAVVKSGNLFGLIRFNTEEIVKPLYKSIKIYDNKIVALKDSNVGLFNTRMKQLTPSIYRGIISMHYVSDGSYIITMMGKEPENIVNYQVYGDNYDDCRKLPISIRPVDNLCADDYIIGFDGDKNICYNVNTGEIIYPTIMNWNDARAYIEYTENGVTKELNLYRKMPNIIKI